MPKVTFITDDNLEIEVSKGTSMQDAAEEALASLPFGCRSGSCGTCRLNVIEGMENLNPMTDREKDLFENLTEVDSQERLGCQIEINGDVKISF